MPHFIVMKWTFIRATHVKKVKKKNGKKEKYKISENKKKIPLKTLNN